MTTIITLIKLLSLVLSTDVLANAARFKRSPMIGGEEAGPNQFPYAVALISPGEEVKCTGGIIGERHILLAAHCVVDRNKKFKKNNLKIIFGTNNHMTDDNAKAIDVKKIFIPSQFTHPISQADIAILQLAEKLKIKKNHLQILQLPVNLTSIAIGRRGIVVGFGASQVSVSSNGTQKVVVSKTFDGKLRFSKVRIIDQNGCRSNISSEIGKYRIQDYHFLAKIVKNSTDIFGLAYGDSGGPFVYKSKIVLGVLVGGYDDECDGRILPSIFIKVESFANFINEVLSGDITERTCVKNLLKNSHRNCNLL